MPLKPLSYRQVKRKLEKAGFTLVQQRGSHVKFAQEIQHEVRTVMVPKHREVRIGTLRSILRQAGLTPDEFNKLSTEVKLKIDIGVKGVLSSHNENRGRWSNPLTYSRSDWRPAWLELNRARSRPAGRENDQT